MQQEKWSIGQIWNDVVEVEKYQPKKRDYISASDVGKPYLDRYFKMNGEPETNPLENRIFRVFNAGVQFHFLLRSIFRKTGLLIDYEQPCEIPATQDTLKIIGFYDMKIGGKVDKEKAEKEILEQEDWTPWQRKVALNVLNYFAEKYPSGIKPYIIEIKSVHSAAFWSPYSYLSEAHIHYQMQLYSYLKAKNIEEGKILYISKDDLTLIEHQVDLNMIPLKEAWEDDVKRMSYYYLNQIEPPREKDIVFDEKKQKFVPNWRIQRSQFLTRITGFKDSKEWTLGLKEKLKEMNSQIKKKATRTKKSK